MRLKSAVQLFTLGTILLLTQFAVGQAGLISNIALGIGSNFYVKSLVGATIQVCVNTGALPLTCTTPVTTYSDPALAHPVVPVADAFGNYSFYVSTAVTSNFVVAINSPGFAPYLSAQAAAPIIAGSGAPFNPAIPPPIGNITPNTGNFTSITAGATILSAGPWVDVRAFGAVCDGAHPTQDTAAFQAAFASLGTGSGTVLFWNTPGSTCNLTGTVDMIGTASGASGQGKFRSLVGMGKSSTITCNPSSPLATCIKADTSHTTLKDFSLVANSNVTYPLEITLASGSTSTEVTNGYNLFINANGAAYGVAVAPDNHGDVSHVSLFGITVTNAAIAGIVVGDGTQGNVLDNECYGCTVDTSAIGVWQKGGGFSFHGGGMDENVIDFEQTTPSSQQFAIDDLRSEGSNQFWTASGANHAAIGGVTISNVKWTSSATPSTNVVSHLTASPITITNSVFGSTVADVSMAFGAGSGSATSVKMSNVGITNSNWGGVLANLAAQTNVSLSSENDFYWTPATDVESAGSGVVYQNGLQVKGAAIVGGNLTVGGNFASALGGFGPYANYVTHSLFDNGLTGWPYVSTLVPTVTTNAGVDIFGNTTAEEITAPSATGGVDIQQTTGLTMSTSGTYQFSFYAQGAAGGEIIAAGLKSSDTNCKPGGGTFPTSWTLTTALTLYTGTCTPTSSELALPYIALNSNASTTTTVYLSQAQVCQVGVDCGPQVITTTATVSGVGLIANGLPMSTATPVTSLSASSPLSASASTGPVTVSCPTCSTSGGTTISNSTSAPVTGFTGETLLCALTVPASTISGTQDATNSRARYHASLTTSGSGSMVLYGGLTATNGGLPLHTTTSATQTAGRSYSVDIWCHTRGSSSEVCEGRIINTTNASTVGVTTTYAYPVGSPIYFAVSGTQTNSGDTTTCNFSEVQVY